MWRRAAKQLDTVRDTWVFIDMSLSIYIPRSRAYFVGATSSAQTRNGAFGVRCCWRDEAHQSNTLNVHDSKALVYCRLLPTQRLHAATMMLPGRDTFTLLTRSTRHSVHVHIRSTTQYRLYMFVQRFRFWPNLAQNPPARSVDTCQSNVQVSWQTLPFSRTLTKKERSKGRPKWNISLAVTNQTTLCRTGGS